MLSHQIRTTTAVRRELGHLAGELGPHFTSASSCLACTQAMGTEPAAALVALTDTLGVVQLAHKSCSSPLVRHVDVLPISAQTGYEYKTLLLPVDNGTRTILVPTILVRLGIDTVFVRRGDNDNWVVSRSNDLLNAGFSMLEGELSVAKAPCSTTLEGNTISVDLPGGQSITLTDTLLPERILEMRSVLVVHLGEGSVEDIVDMDALGHSLRKASTLGALVDMPPVEAQDHTDASPAPEKSVPQEN